MNEDISYGSDSNVTYLSEFTPTPILQICLVFEK